MYKYLMDLVYNEDDIPIEVLDDEQSMMQSSSTSSSRMTSSSEAPDRFFSRIFRFDNSYVDGILSWESSHHFWQVVGDLTHLSRKQIRKIYQVRDPPNDLSPRFKKVFILASLQDSCPSEHMRVTLVDVQYADVANPERKVQWIPFKSTRASILKLLYLDSLCWWTTDECTIRQNGHWVPPEQTDPLDVFDGDYFQIKIALNLDPPRMPL